VRAGPAALMLALAAIRTAAAQAPWPEVTIDGDKPRNGFYDPCLAWDEATRTGWLAYSSIEVPAQVSTHLARSTDGGATWQFATTANRCQTSTIRDERGERIPGVWRHETPALLHDPDDPAAPWKLFCHTYFAKQPYNRPDDRIFRYGWISLSTARDPAGLWTEPEPLLGCGAFPPAPYRCRSDVTKLGPELAQVIILTEPGVLVRDGQIYLALQALAPDPPGWSFNQTLLASADHGQTWRFVATLATAAEAKPFGGDFFTGADLAVQAGRVFLLLCPETRGDPEHAHHGTVVFEFADLATGRLKRGADGHLAAAKVVTPQLDSGGQSTYDEHLPACGLLMPQFDRHQMPRPWRMFATGVGLI